MMERTKLNWEQAINFEEGFRRTTESFVIQLGIY